MSAQMPSLESFQMAHDALCSGGEIEAVILSTDDNASIAAKLQKPLATCDELRLVDLTPGVRPGLRSFVQKLDLDERAALQTELVRFGALPVPVGITLEAQNSALRSALARVVRATKIWPSTDAYIQAKEALLMAGLSMEEIRSFPE